MSARILVVDDILPNVKLLEAKLKGEYYDVLTATNGEDALEIAARDMPDMVLLDIMMPGMDGFEVCTRMKSNPKTAHIPVVMVTALTDATDRVRGLEVGADDFLSKPVNDTALMARVRSLIRLKMTVDEWRMRENTANQFGVFTGDVNEMNEPVEGAKILVVEDKEFESRKFIDAFEADRDNVMSVTSNAHAMELAQQHDFDLITVSLNMASEDGLRLCSQLRSNERSRSVPILMVAEEQDLPLIAQGLEIGAHDYILRPVDRNELLARARTQVRRKRFQDRLRSNYEASLSMALTDSLTGLFNRRYLMVHLEKVLNAFAENKKPFAVLMLDIDYFKQINDTHGHGVGDEVLRIFSDRIAQSLRSFDLVARMGGEEFVAVLPDIKPDVARQVAERLRHSIADAAMVVSNEAGFVDVTVSIGGMMVDQAGMSADEALKISDDALYEAKEGGRDCCFFHDFGMVEKQEKAPELPEEEQEEAQDKSHVDLGENKTMHPPRPQPNNPTAPQPAAAQPVPAAPSVPQPAPVEPAPVQTAAPAPAKKPQDVGAPDIQIDETFSGDYGAPKEPTFD